MKWFIIKTNTSYERVEQLLQELNMSVTIDPLIFVKLGYKNLSTQDKETYYTIRDICLLNLKQKQDPICNVELEYLATIFNTTKTCQKHRLSNLEKSRLITILPNNIYRLCHPLYPDITFVNTLIKLLHRKKYMEYIVQYRNCYNPVLRLNLLFEINKLIKKGVKHTNEKYTEITKLIDFCILQRQP